jgi:3-isopropylmalate/(R)-2-methylmalate dehydratase small subunit
MAKIGGRVRKFGDNVDTDSITPAAYLYLPMEEVKKHAFGPVYSEFYKSVKEGDIIVAGDNFGCGSSREIATEVVKELGIKYIICGSMARIYYRNCISIGLHPLISQEFSRIVDEGDAIEIDTDRQEVKNLANDKTASIQFVPEALQPIVDAGGILEYLKRRLASPDIR